MANYPLYNTSKNKMRVLGFASGSGNTLWKTFELQKQLENTFEGCPFEIVGVFTDSPVSKAVEIAKSLGIPSVSLDIREYYKKAGAPLRDMNLRAEFDALVYEIIQPFQADMILLAGYVWATTDIIVDNYLVIGLHPGDLSVQDGEGHRCFAGADGVGYTLKAKAATICSSAYLATSEIDGGPIMMCSPYISIDYSLTEDFEELRKHYLKAVNDHNRNLAARVVYEVAKGNFVYGQNGELLFRGRSIPKGYKLENWNQDSKYLENNLRKMIAPQSVVVVGASTKGGIGYSIVQNILAGDYVGKLWVTNRNGDSIGKAQGYKSILDLPETPDLAIITTPASAVLGIAEECGMKGVGAMVCITAGFKEIGGLGVEREEKLKDIIDQYNMRLMGPNCMGIINASDNVRINAAMLKHRAKKGNISLITQSGALGAAMLDYAEVLGLGFSVIASLGNQADVTAADLLSYLGSDESTEVILLYLETLADPRRFMQIAYKVSAKKTIIALKSGRSESGAMAASSHTGSIAGSDTSVDALLKKAGILRVDTLEEAYCVATAISRNGLIKGRRIGVITNAGGPGILITDRLIEKGFELPQLLQSDKDELSKILLPEASLNNPIDLVASAPPQHYAEALRRIVNSERYDAAAVVCVPPSIIDTGEVASAIAPIIKSSEFPVICCFIGPSLGKPANEVLRDEGIAFVEYPEKVAEVMSKMVVEQIPRVESMEYNNYDVMQQHKAKRLIKADGDREYMSSFSAFRLLECYGFKVPEYVLIRTLEELTSKEFKFPVVAKIEHESIIHKSDVGGVILGIQDERELKKVVEDLLEHFPGAEGVILQEQRLVKGPELILGGKYENELGHICMVGLGGVMVEIFKDVSIALAPISKIEANGMLSRLKCMPLLKGYRGKAGVDMDGLQDCICKLSNLLVDLPQILEIDLNPLVYNQEKQEFTILDARIRIN